MIINKLDISLNDKIKPRPFQHTALQKWHAANNKGVCELPTGSGKSILGCMVICSMGVSSLIIVPTIDLVQQWFNVITNSINLKTHSLTIWTANTKSLGEITITTYDSAYLICQEINNSFDLLIFDECHHLPAYSYSQIAVTMLSPYRLGLSATLKRSDGKEQILSKLIGKVVYTLAIDQLPKNTVSNYQIIKKAIKLSNQEQELHSFHRNRYLNYLKNQNKSFRNWSEFYATASKTSYGRKALMSFRIQKKIAKCSENKIIALAKILLDHRNDKIIVFTEDNYLAYKIGMRFLLTVLTHHTKLSERRKILDDFSQSRITCLVTSKILNEGVDISDASVAVVASGSGSIREHVQRLGRILRFRDGKHAILYELVSQHTAEISTHHKRNQHVAFKKTVKNN